MFLFRNVSFASQQVQHELRVGSLICSSFINSRTMTEKRMVFFVQPMWSNIVKVCCKKTRILKFENGHVWPGPKCRIQMTVFGIRALSKAELYLPHVPHTFDLHFCNSEIKSFWPQRNFYSWNILLGNVRNPYKILQMFRIAESKG